MAKLLVVDDEPDVCELLAAALSEAGYAVRTCTNGTEAIELFRRERADLVFCDLKLPGIDGLSVLEAMKGIDPWATVIMVTGYGSVEVATHALRLGAYDFVEKPFTDTQIQKVASRALEHRRQLRQLTLVQGKSGSAADIPARLVELEQLRADFLNMVIQDLRTPLGQLNKALALANEGFYGPWDDPKQPFLHELARVRALLSRLLLEGFALFLSHEQRVTATLGDVRSVLEGIVKEMRGQCEKRQLMLKTALPSSPVEGSMDTEKLACIARELLENAVHFTESGGKITVSLVSQQRGFQLQVVDTGCGIAEKEQGWLFTAFRQLRTDRPEQRKKLGLGLALVKYYTDLLNGTIHVQSTPGKGSEFTVNLPWLNRTDPVQNNGR